MWNTDASRLTYIVRLLEDNKAVWRRDNKGVEVKEKIVKPMLSYLDKHIMKYMNKLHEIIMEKNAENCQKDSDRMEILAELQTEVKNENLPNRIIRYLTPHFYTNCDQLLIK
jgi:hypothetical protein